MTWVRSAKWLVYHLANLELYLAVVPFAVAPIVLSLVYRRARDGSERHAAFIALFVSANATFLVLVAGFNSTIWAGERLHDRPLFYVVPLWLVVLFVWLAEGLPRPRDGGRRRGSDCARAATVPALPEYVAGGGRVAVHRRCADALVRDQPGTWPRSG